MKKVSGQKLAESAMARPIGKDRLRTGKKKNLGGLSNEPKKGKG